MPPWGLEKMHDYILMSTVNGSFYVGMTSEPIKRLAYHNSGHVKSTKSKRPWEIVHLEEFDNRIEAREREKYLKSAAGRRFRKEKLGL